MLKKMLFSSLVKEYSVPIVIIRPDGDQGGEYINGEWFPKTKKPEHLEGAVIPYTDREIFQSGGSLTARDRQLAFLGELELGTKVIDKGFTYEIISVSPYMDHYSDTNLYQLREVDCFD